MRDTVAVKVLVVEDDEAVLRMMTQVLSQDFIVFSCSNAEDALEILKKEKVQAVVSDHQLPGMLGVALLRRVSALQPEAARILVTASNRVEDAQDAINVARVERFLSKPFRMQELLEKVSEAIHEATLVSIRERLVRELKERNGLLARALADADREQKEEKGPDLEGLAFRDALTGLFNHRYFQEALSAELTRARRRRRPLALVLVDVDDFRGFNLAQGYEKGDRLLQRLAQSASASAEDALWASGGAVEIASRYAPDVLGVIFPGADEARARTYADDIRGALARSIASNEADYVYRPEGAAQSRPVSLSVAIALFPDHGDTERQLIAAAERAIAVAKAAGGNRVQLAEVRAPPA